MVFGKFLNIPVTGTSCLFTPAIHYFLFSQTPEEKLCLRVDGNKNVANSGKNGMFQFKNNQPADLKRTINQMGTKLQLKQILWMSGTLDLLYFKLLCFMVIIGTWKYFIEIIIWCWSHIPPKRTRWIISYNKLQHIPTEHSSQGSPEIHTARRPKHRNM